VVVAFVVPPLLGGAVALLRAPPELQVHALLTGARPAIYGRTAAGSNFMIVGSGHSEPLLDRALPFHDGDLDLVILLDSSRRATDVVAAVAQGRRIARVWTPELDLAAGAFADGRDREIIAIDAATRVEVLRPVGESTEFAVRLVAGEFSLLLPPGTAPLTTPPQWRGDLVLLGDRPPPAFATAGFRDATGADALLAGLGGSGRAVIVPGDAPVRRAKDGAAVRLEQTGGAYSVTFVRS